MKKSYGERVREAQTKPLNGQSFDKNNFSLIYWNHKTTQIRFKCSQIYVLIDQSASELLYSQNN